MNIRDIREIMGLSQSQVADELGVPRQEVIDCEEHGETYLLLQYISAFPINPQILQDPDADPFLPSFDQTTPGQRMALWREENGISLEALARKLGISAEEERRFEAGETGRMTRRRGEEIEKKTGINRKWLMYGDGREKGTPRFHPAQAPARKAESQPGGAQAPAPNREAGARIRQARTDTGLTREELAGKLNLSVSRVTQMEAGYVRDQKAEQIIRMIREAAARTGREDPRSAGLRLREARKEAGLSVREAAELLGLKQTTLAHLESGYVTGRHADELIGQIRKAPGKPSQAAFDPRQAGLRIREERIRAGLSQKELGTILRMPTSRVSLIELGNVTEKEMERILLRIHGKPTREVRNIRVKPTEQVILGSNIRDARVRAGLSQKELGELLEFPQTRISMIERGRVDEPTAKRILQILDRQAGTRNAESSGAPQKSAAQARAAHAELGRRMMEARKAAGLNQKEAGNLIGVSQGRISYMEQGKADEETIRRAIALLRDRNPETGKSNT